MINNKFDIQRFKSELLAKGINWSDEQIENFIISEQAGKDIQVEMLKDNNPELYDAVKLDKVIDTWEGPGNISSIHKNPGNHVWTPTLAKKFGAKKGSSFPDSNGDTMYYAKYDTVEAGEKAQNFVMHKIAREEGNARAFVDRYADKEKMIADSGIKAYEDYVSDVSKAFNPIATGPTISAFNRFQSPSTLPTQGQKNKAYDAVGNFLWEAMDTATFGAASWADWTDPIEEYLTEGGPETFAGRVGAGLGGFAGFALPFGPFGVAKGVAKKAVQGLSKYSSTKAAKAITKTGSDYLTKKAIAKPLEYGAFNKLSPMAKESLFKPITSAAFGTQFSKSKVKEAFGNVWSDNVKTAVKSQLRIAGLDPSKKTIDKIFEIVNTATTISGKRIIPISTLQERIAMALGTGVGASKLASIASHALEEGVIFAMAETPFEYFQSQEEDREADYGGRAGHAFLLGNALGLIRFKSGGRDWGVDKLGKQRSMTKAALQGIKNKINKKTPYNSLNVNDPKDIEKLRLYGQSILGRGGDILNKLKPKDAKYLLNTMDDVDDLLSTGAGAKAFIGILNKLQKEASDKFFPLFFKEAKEDFVGSIPRMLMGSAAFNYEMIFHDDIPLEDKVFHTVLGAFMTKGGRRLRYRDTSGHINFVDTGNYKNIRQEFINTSNYLDLMGMHPNTLQARALEMGMQFEQKYHQNIEETPDIQKLKNILKKTKNENNELISIIESDGIGERLAPKNASNYGDFPIFDQASHVYEYFGPQNHKVVSPHLLTRENIKKIEKALGDATFEALDGNGIKNPTDFDDIIYHAADKVNTKMINVLEKSSVGIYEYLRERQTYAERSVIEPEIGSDGKPRYTLFPIESKFGQPFDKDYQKIIYDYHRQAKVLARHGYIEFVENNPDLRLVVENKDFEGIKATIDNYRSQMNQIIHGDKKPNLSIENPELMELGWIDQIVDFHSFNKGYRNSHEKLHDLNNNSNVWFKQEHPGQVEKAFRTLFRDGDVLYKEFDFTNVKSEKMRNFLSTMLEVLKSDPMSDTRIQMEHLAKTKVMGSNDIGVAKDLMKIFRENGMTGFMQSDQKKLNMFISAYKNHTLRRFLKGAVKRDGKSLNPTDYAILTHLMSDRKLMGPNFEMTEIIGVIKEIDTVLGPKVGVNKFGNLVGWKTSRKERHEDLANMALNADGSINPHKEYAKRALEEIASNEGKDAIDMMNEWMSIYKTMIQPYEVQATGNKVNGFLKYKGDIAQVSFAELWDMARSLEGIAKIKERKSHDDFLYELEKARNNDMPEGAKKEISYLFDLYKDGHHNTGALIRTFADNKLFDYGDAKLKNVDMDNPTITEKIKDIVKFARLDIAGSREASKIENDINEYRDLNERKTGLDKHTTITRQTFIGKYGLDKKYDFDKLDIEQLFKDMNYESLTKEFKAEAANDIIKLDNTSVQSKVIPRFYPIENAGFYAEKAYTTYDNSIFRFFDSAINKDTKVEHIIVDHRLTSKDNTMLDSRIDNKAKKEIADMLNGDETTTHIDKSLTTDIDNITLMQYNSRTGYLQTRWGDLQYSIGVSKADLPGYAQSFNEKLKDWKKTYGRKHPEVISKIEDSFHLLFDKKENSVNAEKLVVENKQELQDIFTLKETTDAIKMGGRLQNLMTADYFHRKFGKYAWDILEATNKGNNPELVAKIDNRIKLMGNTSMKEISPEHIDFTLKILNKSKSYNKDLIKNIKDLRDNGIKSIVVADETGSASIINRLEKQLDESIAKAKGTEWEGKILKYNKDEGLGINQDGKTWAGGGDISAVDSHVILHPRYMNALYGLAGSGNIEGLGGIKPILHRFDGANGGVMIDKTAFVSNPKWTKFMDDHDVGMVRMESANKINYAKPLDGTPAKNVYQHVDPKTQEPLPLESMYDLTIPNISKYIEKITYEDLSLGSIVNTTKKAGIPHQAFKDLSVGESRDVYDWLIKPKFKKFAEVAEGAFSNNISSSIAEAKKLNHNQDLKDTYSGYDRWLEANGPVNTPLWEATLSNQIKSKYIDKGLMLMETDKGGQAVTSPGLSLKYPEFTTDGKVYSYGEGSIPHNAGKKRINLNNFFLIDKKDVGMDKIVQGTDIKGIGLTGNMTFEKAFKAVDAYNKKAGSNYQIEAVFRRNPNTRPGDMMIVGIKDILPKGYGNTAKLNAYDFAMRAEGDHDVDKVDFFWDTPKSTLKKWNALSGEIKRVLPEATNKKTTLTSDLNFLDYKSLNTFRDSKVAAEKMRGPVVKTQRLMQGLREYNSTSSIVDKKNMPIKGFAMRIEGTEGKGYIYVNPKLERQSIKRLAEDIQRVTDSNTGFNKDLYNNEWFNRFLFGDGNRYTGIFSKATWQNIKAEGKSTNKFVAEDSPYRVDKKIEQELVLTAIQPYRSMLQLGTSLYSNGKAQSVRYNDILSTMKFFDARMKNINSYAYKKIKQNYPNEADSYFKDAKNQWIQIYGDFPNKIRPNFSLYKNKKTKDNEYSEFSNQLVFERTMSNLAFHDKMVLEKPSKLYGKELDTFHQYFDEMMFTENYSQVAGEIMKRINKNHKLFNFVNYLDWQISKQKSALREAYSTRSRGLAEMIKENIKEVENRKKSLEDEMIDIGAGSAHEKKTYASKIRAGAYQSVKRDFVDKLGNIPNWNNLSGTKKPYFSSKKEASDWINRKGENGGADGLRKYVSAKGAIRLVGMHTNDHVELVKWDNMIGKFAEIEIDASALFNKSINKEMSDRRKDFIRFKNQKWAKNLSGADHTLDKNQVSSIIMDKLEKDYDYFNSLQEGGFGNLYLLQLMAPKTDPYKYTYFSERISPAYKPGSLSMIKLGLKFINNAKDYQFTEGDKKRIFGVFATGSANIERAMRPGQKGERGPAEWDIMSDVYNRRNDILEGMPLIDDMPFWTESVQEVSLNPGLYQVFGVPNKSLAQNLATEVFSPNIVRELGQASMMSYMPTGYIPSHTMSTRYPGITGWKSFTKAVEGDARILLGNQADLNLLRPKAPISERAPYKDIHSTKGKGADGIMDTFLKQINCEQK